MYVLDLLWGHSVRFKKTKTTSSFDKRQHPLSVTPPLRSQSQEALPPSCCFGVTRRTWPSEGMRWLSLRGNRDRLCDTTSTCTTTHFRPQECIRRVAHRQLAYLFIVNSGTMSADMKDTPSRDIPAPTRRVTVHDAAHMPQDYSSTPGGTLFSTTPGGNKYAHWTHPR